MAGGAGFGVGRKVKRNNQRQMYVTHKSLKHLSPGSLSRKLVDLYSWSRKDPGVYSVPLKNCKAVHAVVKGRTIPSLCHTRMVFFEPFNYSFPGLDYSSHAHVLLVFSLNGRKPWHTSDFVLMFMFTLFLWF